ncbi:MAG: sigma 54-interacting transcriptional regulator [Opitutaceae bacterium]|nr:sigma 54-interacting transcriptional regulator [Opitutaceae bacterium]
MFTPEERPVAEALAGIPFVNPFTAAREQLERAVLGDQFQAPARYLLPGQPLHRIEGNLGKLLERADVLLEAVAARLARRTSIGAVERDIYEGLVHFVVFHRHAAGFDHLIAAALPGSDAILGGGRGGVIEADAKARATVGTLFERCRRDLVRLLSGAAFGGDIEQAASLWFAFYFQVRRAWVHTFAFIHGGSDALVALRARLWQSIFTHDMRRYQRTLYSRMGDITTLITGPSGSGKELVARAIGLSRFVPFDARERRFAADFAASFHPLNLSALSPTLIESELFGHRRGAFTGALGDREGYFETCGVHGTVFLDEIGETAPEIQVKLLRVLQTREFNRLGDTERRRFHGRIVAATNRDLAAEIRAGRFREDFFFRLCADRIETPPLRDILGGNIDELRCLVAHICTAQAGATEGPPLCDEVVTWIGRELGRSYPWPGNFRELEQCVRNFIVHGSYRPPIGPRAGGVGDLRGGDWVSAAQAGRLTMDALLQAYCRRVFDEAGSLEEAARRLDCDRRTVRRYVRSGAESPESDNT